MNLLEIITCYKACKDLNLDDEAEVLKEIINKSIELTLRSVLPTTKTAEEPVDNQ